MFRIAAFVAVVAVSVGAGAYVLLGNDAAAEAPPPQPTVALQAPIFP